MPESWLPTFLGKFVQCKSRLCFEMVTKTNQYNVKKWFIPIRIDPQYRIFTVFIKIFQRIKKNLIYDKSCENTYTFHFHVAIKDVSLSFYNPYLCLRKYTYVTLRRTKMRPSLESGKAMNIHLLLYPSIYLKCMTA